MAQDRRPAIFAIEKLVEEQVDRDAEWPEGEVSDVFGEVEEGECDGE